MFKSLLSFLILGIPLVLRATEPALPSGLEVGEKVYSIPADATSLESAGWVLLSKGEVALNVENGGMQITSVEENPFLELSEQLSGDTVIEIGIQFDSKKNHFFRLSFFDTLGLEYNSQFKRFAFLEKTNPKPSAYEFDLIQQKPGELDTFVTNPEDFTIVIAVTNSKAMVWCDQLQLFSVPLENFDLSGYLRVRSGWHSDWKITFLNIYRLQKLP